MRYIDVILPWLHLLAFGLPVFQAWKDNNK
jgi:hypothetical protein